MAILREEEALEVWPSILFNCGGDERLVDDDPTNSRHKHIRSYCTRSLVSDPTLPFYVFYFIHDPTKITIPTPFISQHHRLLLLVVLYQE